MYYTSNLKNSMSYNDIKKVQIIIRMIQIILQYNVPWKILMPQELVVLMDGLEWLQNVIRFIEAHQLKI